jgi:hypothetical protein
MYMSFNHMYMSFNTRCCEHFNVVIYHSQSHLSWKMVQCFTEPCYKMWHNAHSQTPNIMYFHTVYLELAFSNPTSLPTYSRSIEGYRHPRSLNPLLHPDTLAYAAPATWAMSREGWLGALDFVWWVLGLRYAMCRWRSTPSEWWNIIWHIQTLNTKDLQTAVVVANTPPRKPDFARLTCPCATLAPQHTWRKKWRVLPVCKDSLRPPCCGSRRDDPLYIDHQTTPQGVHIRTVAQQFTISFVAEIKVLYSLGHPSRNEEHMIRANLAVVRWKGLGPNTHLCNIGMMVLRRIPTKKNWRFWGESLQKKNVDMHVSR